MGASVSSHCARAAVTASRARPRAEESRRSISARKGESSTSPLAASGALTRLVTTAVSSLMGEARGDEILLDERRIDYDVRLRDRQPERACHDACAC